MLKDLNSILGYIERLNQLDTTNVEPMAQVASRYGAAKDASAGEAFAAAMRPDELRPSLPHEEAMSNAPLTDGRFFKVPKVIER
jgi:aspartyl-tRNA(Asn)/glutamyl-tRNA(Gln) amidotransferase subunit C